MKNAIANAKAVEEFVLKIFNKSSKEYSDNIKEQTEENIV